MGPSSAGGMNVFLNIMVKEKWSHLRRGAMVDVDEPQLAWVSAMATQHYSATWVSDADCGGCVGGCEATVAEHTDG